MDIGKFSQRQSRLPQMNGTQQAGINTRGDQLDPNSQQTQQAQQSEAPAAPSRRGFSQAELENLLRNADTDRDGAVSLEELQAYQQQLFSMQSQFARSGGMDAIIRQLDILKLLLTPAENPNFNVIAGLAGGDPNVLTFNGANSDIALAVGEDGIFNLEDIQRLGGQLPSLRSPGRPPIAPGSIHRPPQVGPRRGRGGGGISGIDFGGMGVVLE